MSIRAEIQMYIDKVLGDHKEELGARLARLRQDLSDAGKEISQVGKGVAQVRKDAEDAGAQVNQQIMELAEQDRAIKKELNSAVAGQKKYATKLLVVVSFLLILLLAYVNYINWQGLQSLRIESRNAVEALRLQGLTTISLVCNPRTIFDGKVFNGLRPGGTYTEFKFKWDKPLRAAPVSAAVTTVTWIKGNEFARKVSCGVSTFDAEGVTLMIHADRPAPELEVTVVAVVRRCDNTK